MDFQVSSGAVSSIISVLVVALFIHFGAKSVTGDGGLIRAIIVALLGSLLAGIIWAAVGGTLGLILAVAAWALVAAVMYRTSWVGGLLIGVVAWVLWLLVSWVIGMIF